MSFGPHPRDYGLRPPAGVRRAALRSVLSYKLETERLSVLEAFPLPEAKTKRVAESLAPWGQGTILVVIPEEDAALERSARNMPRVKILRAGGLNCYDLLRHEALLILKDSLPLIEERLGKK